MKSETFRKQALSLIVFFVAIAAVFALTRLRSDPAGKQAQTILTQLLSSSDAVEPAADDSYTASEPGLVQVDDGGFAGYVIWHPYDDVSMELGWVLDRSRWGRGYAGELTRLLTDRARRQGRGVVIECVPEQTVTRHIAEKSGFRFCGMAEGCCVYRRQPDEKEPL